MFIPTITISTVEHLIRIWKNDDSSICHLSCFVLFILFIILTLICLYDALPERKKRRQKVDKTYKIVAEDAKTDIKMWKVGRRRNYPEVGKTTIFDNDGGMTDTFILHVGMADRKKVPWRMSAALGGCIDSVRIQ